MITEAEKFLISQGLNLSPSSGYNFNPNIEYFKVRDQYLKKYGFAIPNEHALKTIAAASPILEIGAGSGYWAHELRNAGADVVATDPATGKYTIHKNGFWEFRWEAVERLPANEAINIYSNRVLLTVWPDYDCEWPLKALEVYSGKNVFYIGEGDGGCTGNDAFHNYLSEHFGLVDEIGIPQFPGIHDRLFWYQRKRE